jgi:hypothetical protein
VCAFVADFDDKLPDKVYNNLHRQLAFDLKQKLQMARPQSYGPGAACLAEQIDRGGRGERLRPQ